MELNIIVGTGWTWPGAPGTLGYVASVTFDMSPACPAFSFGRVRVHALALTNEQAAKDATAAATRPLCGIGLTDMGTLMVPDAVPVVPPTYCRPCCCEFDDPLGDSYCYDHG